jgi:hypothetical protein
MDGPTVPEDYRAFVFAHADRVRAAVAALTGNDKLVRRLEDEAFAAVAGRWWWRHRLWPGPWRSRPEAAADYLWSLLRREASGWPTAESRSLTFQPAPLPTAVAADEAYRRRADRVAATAWARAGRQRRLRLTVAGVAVLALACATLILPGRKPAADRLDPGPLVTSAAPFVSAAPPNVEVVPTFDVLARATARETPVPGRIDLSAGAARPLRDDPPARAVLLAQRGDGPLLVVDEDGRTSAVDADELGGARALESSLSPDGALAAIPARDGVLLVDIGRGTVRKLASAVPGPTTFRPTLTWRGPTTLLVAQAGDTVLLDVTADRATRVPGLTGVHTVVQQGRAAGLAELLPVGPEPGQPAMLRAWAGLTGATLTGTAQNREVTGAAWLGGWLGAGWANGSLVVRASVADALRLPPTAGTPTRALVALDLTDGRMVSALAVVEPGVNAAVLGWLDGRTALVLLERAPAALLIGWNVTGRSFALVATIDGDATLSVADLLSWR